MTDHARLGADVPPAGKVNLMLLASTLWIGGSETVIRHLAEGIDRRRFNVTVCHLKQRGHIGDEIARAGIDIVGVSNGPPGRTDYLTFLKLLRLIRQRKIHVVHTHNVDGLADAAICRLLMPGLKLAHTFHFGNYPHVRARLLRIERFCSSFANRLFSVGEVQQQQIRAVHKLRFGAISTIWNGVPLPTGAASEARRSFRQRLGAEDRIVIGTIATFIEQKGLRDLLRVARRIADSRSNVRFVVVGEGKLRPELEAMRAELGLDDVVTFTGWVQNAASVALPAFDVFFQPSLWEAMSVVILEAMAAGKPIVATRVGENTHIVKEGVNGFAVDSGDIAAMAEALDRLIDDGELRQRLGARGRLDVQERYTIEHMTRAYEDAYLDMVR